MKQKLLGRIIKNDRVKKVAAAVSGGCDSVALLLLLRHLAKMRGFALSVFHVDHGLRESSNEEAEWVQRLAGKFKLSFFSRTAEEKDRADMKAGVEAWARQFRYNSFKQMAKESGVDTIATGHNADDQLETFFMRLFKGASLQGIAGIRAFKTIENFDLKLWRPLLQIQRSELESYLKNENQTWLTDESNFSQEYLRNVIRHRLMPEITDIFPGAVNKIQPLLEDINEVQIVIADSAAEYLKDNLVEDNRLKISEVPEIYKREIFRQWLIRLGFDREISRSFILRLVDLWNINASNRQVDHRNYSFIRKPDLIVFKGK
ncbi:MAG: tRNA lysidine(34) synthetase TilS [Candidatus Rifleibacteriota bacterium]